MSAGPASLTRTEKNLWNAIVSEALANLKYNAYAQRAMQEGHPEVAQIFQEVAGAETVHGINHLRVTGDMASTAENLRAIIEGEAQEAATIYPMMIREALEEGNPGGRPTLSPWPWSVSIASGGIHGSAGWPGGQAGSPGWPRSPAHPPKSR